MIAFWGMQMGDGDGSTAPPECWLSECWMSAGPFVG